MTPLPTDPVSGRNWLGQIRGIGLAAATAGILLIAALVLHFGNRSILDALALAGLRGLLWLCICHLGILLVMGAAWRALLPGPWPTGLAACVGSRMIREAGSEALPLSQLGGYVLGTVALSRSGYPLALASATTMVDVSLEVVAQIGFILTGLALLTGQPRASELVIPALVGLLVLASLIGLFLLVQRRDGHSRLGAFLTRRSMRVGESWDRLRGQLRTIHANPRALALCTLLHLLCWFAIAAEAWLALHLMHIPITAEGAIILESLMFAMRTAGFAIPNALGVQEAAYVMLAGLTSLSPGAALSLSLLKRARDISLGLLALSAWPLCESKLAVHREPPVAGEPNCEPDH